MSMNAKQASGFLIAGTLAVFFVLCAFNVGRLTASTLTVKDQCGQTLSYTTPFKGTLP